MNTTKVCECERELRRLEDSGKLEASIGSYGIGMRTTAVVVTLALAKVYADAIGEKVECPDGWQRAAWDETLDNLITLHLGNSRCLDCKSFFDSNRPGGKAFLAWSTHEVLVPCCPVCGNCCSEPIGRAAVESEASNGS